MADLSELLKSKKVSEFVRQGKSRPWTVENFPTEPSRGFDNPVKTESQPGQNPVINPVKTESQPGQNPVIIISKKTPKKENPVKTESPTRSRFEGNPVKTESQPGQKIRDYKTLVGNDRNVLFALFFAAQRRGSVETSAFSRQALASQLGLSYEAVRSSIKRLLQFSILEKIESSKGGPGAWVLVRFSQRVFEEITLTESQLSQNQVTNPVKTESQLSHQPGQTLPSSSSIKENEKNFKTTTTSEPETFSDSVYQLNPVWSSIDTSPLFEIGFTKTHLIQLARYGKISAEEVQDSINFFAFDLVRNGKAKELKGPPLNFFMGILRKGLPYSPPENFESPEAEARRKYLEGKRRIEEQRLAAEQELKTLAFATWRRSLTDAQARELVPESLRSVPQALQASLRVYFDEHVYSSLEATHSNETEPLRLQVSAAITQSFEETTR